MDKSKRCVDAVGDDPVDEVEDGKMDIAVAVVPAAIVLSDFSASISFAGM